MKAFLIDGTSFCYRAHYAIRELTTSTGRPTNAIYGFILILNKIIQDEKPDLLGVAFDLKAPTFRHKKFKDYKIHRPPMPDKLVEQMPVIKKVIKAHNIALFEKEGYEAEDVIATIAKVLADKGIEVYIATGDKDILQLVNKNVKVYNTHKEGLIYDEEKVEEKYGVRPERIVDLMALMGDKIDNIPGVPGIGIKTAGELVKKYGSLENVLDNIDKLKSEKLQDILKKHSENAKLSKELARIQTGVPIKFKIEQLEASKPNRSKLFEIFKELELKTLMKKFAPKDKWEADYKLISEDKGFERLIKGLKEKEIFAFDFETTDVNPHQAEPIGISFCFKEKEAYYLPLLDKGEKNREGILKDYFFEEMKPIFEDSSIKKIGQNIKYELIILKRFGLQLKGIHFDSMIASYLLNPSKLNHNLEDISLEYLNHKMIPFSELIDKNKKGASLKDADLEKLTWYACEDSDVVFRLYKKLEDKLKEKELFELFSGIEMPLVEVLADMELAGISVDEEKLKNLSRDLSEELDKAKENIFNIVGTEFNINSPQQLREILFDKLKLPIVKRTKTGPSTDVEVLEKLSAEHKLPRHLLKFRELSKLKTGYIDSLPKLINSKTGRIHTSFNQTITQTGRLSSSRPNLQNIPAKGELSRKIREAFIPEKGNSFLSADYSQIELRILAHLSGDENLKKAFKSDLDIHSFTASLIFDKDLSEITGDMRAVAKTVNFSIIYGVSPYGLSKGLNVEVVEAKKFIDSYFERYPKVKKYVEAVIKEAENKGYVATLFGRRRYIPQINSLDKNEANFARRIALNSPIQGTASDLIKSAMIDINHRLKEENYASKMILQIHDELIFEITPGELDSIKHLVKDKMENAVKLSVPIKVAVKTGKNWSEI
jgi:DNA polymerase I